MTDIAVPDTTHYVDTLNADVARIKNEATRLSPRTIQLRMANCVASATTEIIQSTARSIEDSHRLTKASNSRTEWVLHYTSIDTLLSMLEEDHYIRMSSSLGFNDPDEGQYLWRSTLGLAQAREAGFLPQQQEANEGQSHAYIASFILNHQDAADNNIPYWMHYGNDGNGVAIKVAIPTDLLYQVRYGHEEALETVATIKSHIDPLLEVVENLEDDQVSMTAKSIIQRSLQRLNFLYKSRYYAYEQECRAIELPDQTALPLQITYGGSYGTKAFRSHLNHPSLSTEGTTGLFQSGSELIIGPCVENRQDAVNYLKTRFEKAGLHTQVKTSQINYRRSGNR